MAISSPGRQIQTYNYKMDDKRARRMCMTGCDASRLAKDVARAAAAFVVGGQLYQQLPR